MAQTSVDAKELAAAIREAVEEAAPVKQVHPSRYRAKTPWNPEGRPLAQRPRLKANTRFFQNGRMLFRDRLTDEQIRLLNQLKPGRYINRKVEVIERVDGNGAADIDLRHAHASMQERMEFQSSVRSFTDMLQQIVSEQEAAGK